MSELPRTPPEGEPTRPGSPTPEDPRQREPIHDPPVHPEHDPRPGEPVRKATGRNRGAGERGVETPDATQPEGGVRAPDPSPDRVVFDENERPG